VIHKDILGLANVRRKLVFANIHDLEKLGNFSCLCDIA